MLDRTTQALGLRRRKQINLSPFPCNELEPIQSRMLQINEWLGEEVIRFKPFELGEGS